MKLFTLTISFLFVLSITCYAQNAVVDTHPNSTIYAIDYSTGQEAFATGDAAILFKDAYIELVSNTSMAKMARANPGKKTFVITQMDPQTNGNAYQCLLENKFLGQNTTLCTFIYDVDKNSLSYYNPENQNYFVIQIQGPNINNLNNCAEYGKFNIPAPPQAPQAENAAIDNTPADAIDADVSTETAPPAMPDLPAEQPECPVDGYLWQPGFWAYNAGGGYYWVPGVWVASPNVGYLWTPPYWGYEGRVYLFHRGYWGNTVGFYGGVNYGYGYGGEGYGGGGWHEGHYRYNTAVVRVNTTVIHNTYIDNTVIVRGERNRTAFNGQGGIDRRPNEREIAASHETHVNATQEQIRNQSNARADRSQFASTNGGRPNNLGLAKSPATMPANTGARTGTTNMTGGTSAPAHAGTPENTGTRPGNVPTVAGAGSARAAGAPQVPGTRPPGVPGAPQAPGARTAGSPGAAGAGGNRPGFGSNAPKAAPKASAPPASKKK